MVGVEGYGRVQWRVGFQRFFHQASGAFQVERIFLSAGFLRGEAEDGRVGPGRAEDSAARIRGQAHVEVEVGSVGSLVHGVESHCQVQVGLVQGEVHQLFSQDVLLEVVFLDLLLSIEHERQLLDQVEHQDHLHQDCENSTRQSWESGLL